jgi:hypothetical protein
MESWTASDGNPEGATAYMRRIGALHRAWSGTRSFGLAAAPDFATSQAAGRLSFGTGGVALDPNVTLNAACPLEVS